MKPFQGQIQNRHGLPSTLVQCRLCHQDKPESRVCFDGFPSTKIKFWSLDTAEYAFYERFESNMPLVPYIHIHIDKLRLVSKYRILVHSYKQVQTKTKKDHIHMCNNKSVSCALPLSILK